MRICLVLEGCYPYVHGGVSTWMHSYIEAMKEHEFVLWVIGAKAEDRGKFVYDLPDNVVEVHEVFLDDALRLSGERAQVSFTEEELRSLRELVNLGSPDWDVLFNLFHTRGVHPLSFLQSREFIDLFTQICMEEYPYAAYADAFHTVRSMLLPVLYLMGCEVPEAQIYHAISTGYGGLLACLGVCQPCAGIAYGTWHLYALTRRGNHFRRMGVASVPAALDPLLLHAFGTDLPSCVAHHQLVRSCPSYPNWHGCARRCLPGDSQWHSIRTFLRYSFQTRRRLG